MAEVLFYEQDRSRRGFFTTFGNIVGSLTLVATVVLGVLGLRLRSRTGCCERGCTDGI